MSDPATDVSGYVLAGGRSSRMGRDKTLLPLAGTPLVQHALARLKLICAEVAILSGPAHAERDAVLAGYARIVPDADNAHSGPLAGVCAALADCMTKYALIVAVDQPNISGDVLRLLRNASKQEQASGACFSLDSRPEPLPLLLARDLQTALSAAFCAGERRILPALFAAAAAENRTFLQLPFCGPEQVFTNLNTPHDAEQWSARHIEPFQPRRI